MVLFAVAVIAAVGRPAGYRFWSREINAEQERSASRSSGMNPRSATEVTDFKHPVRSTRRARRLRRCAAGLDPVPAL
jgi:hypothetical protein